MITFDQIKRLMSFDIKKKYCIEIAFSVADSVKFDFCWMGKLPDKETGADVYWFGLTEDGENGFDYPTFEEFASAKVFDVNRSIGSQLSISKTVTSSQISKSDLPSKTLADANSSKVG